MFTGIVDGIGQVASVRMTSAGRRISIQSDSYWNDVPLGGSIAVDGVCLTLVAKSAATADFDVVDETLFRTTLSKAVAGVPVNLEKSMRADARFDGHFVLGHVETTTTVRKIDQRDGESKWWFDTPASLRRYVLPKGSISIDGISLTVVDATDDAFSVVLIPTTLQMTTLGRKQPGHAVNLESDMLVRSVVCTVDRVLSAMPPPPADRRRYQHAE